MRKSQISASMMCSNLVDLQATIDVFEKEKVEYLHIDVMDGEFVPNFGLGVDYIRGLRELTSIPLDLHLMIKDPEYKLPWIGIYKEDIVTIHYESNFPGAARARLPRAVRLQAVPRDQPGDTDRADRGSA
mgnify:CR=1 FL=1